MIVMVGPFFNWVQQSESTRGHSSRRAGVRVDEPAFESTFTSSELLGKKF
jgi:hypothetical protein